MNLVDDFLQSVIEFLPHLIFAIVFLMILKLASGIIYRGVNKGLSKRFRPGVAETLARLVNYIILGVGITTIFQSLGVDLTSLVALAGGFGIMVGYALAPYQGNIIAGLILLWDEHFKIGDMVKVDGFFGKIDKITLRETHLTTPDGRGVSLPNSTILDGAVENYSEQPRVLIASFTLTPDTEYYKQALNHLNIEPSIGLVLAEMGTYVQNNVNEANKSWYRLLASDEEKHDIHILTEIKLGVERAEPDILSNIMLTIDEYCRLHNIPASKPKIVELTNKSG